jgi:hypothetical protein
MLSWMISLVRHTVVGTVIFVTWVAGGTYYLQSSLLLVKTYGPYMHWIAILFALPVIAGLAHRIAGIRYPFTNVLTGTLISAAILYPQYKKLWAVPPTTTDIVIYSIIIFGIGYLATQSIRNTFMVAFHMGRYSIQKISPKGKTGKRTSSSIKTQPAYANHGQTLAMLELAIGVCSLGLSIFSVFFLGNA